jgi:polyhydroxyalkanoate synthase
MFGLPNTADPRNVLQQVADTIWDQVDTIGLQRALLREAGGLARHPVGTLSAVGRYAVGAATTASAVASRAVGGKADGPLPVPAKDRRFTDKLWSDNALFYGLLQAHLLRERLAQELVDASGLDGLAAKKARFASQLVVDALAPANFALSNPVVMRRALETGGLSLGRGLKMLISDLRSRGGMPKQVDASGFHVGQNIACTPGKVVFRNALMELIQYSPQTPQTFAVPMLYSPPWINKYYIMDLAPGRSFVEWAVKRGHTAFMISYKNPDASMRDVSLDDYLTHGPIAALKVVREITGQPKVNMSALCLGGTLTAMLLAWLDAGGEDLVNSVTLTNTLVDFSDPGVLGIFTDPETRATMGRRMAKKGYLDSADMSFTFNLLRSVDLIYNYISTSWLQGDEPPAFDLLAWNGDGTRMPAAMHQAYLESCYAENRISRGEMVLGGRKIDLKRVKQDAFVLAAVDDHIAPWKTQYKTTGLFSGKSKFVLSSSGHIAGIVNPPSKNAVHWVNDEVGADPDAWLAGATKKTETWWEEWSRWIGSRAGELGPPPPMGGPNYPPLCDAPGTYVLEK